MLVWYVLAPVEPLVADAEAAGEEATTEEVDAATLVDGAGVVMGLGVVTALVKDGIGETMVCAELLGAGS